MSDSNQETRVQYALDKVQGPLPGDDLLAAFAKALTGEPVFQAMFGASGERIFYKKRPNMNQTILPALLLSWKSENFTSLNAYFEGSIEALLALPVKLEGDFNALRRVGSLLQRWMGGSMNLFFSSNPNVPNPTGVAGLIKFGYGALFDYSGLAQFDGIRVPCIQINLPFVIDMNKWRMANPGTDFDAPIDQSDLDWIEEYLLEVTDSEKANVLIPQGVLSETGETN